MKGDPVSWFDNFWRRRKGQAADDAVQEPESAEDVAEELEEEAHEARDEQALEEPRPPGG
jgi:hypothetical protein